jgi:hypothetical protein
METSPMERYWTIKRIMFTVIHIMSLGWPGFQTFFSCCCRFMYIDSGCNTKLMKHQPSCYCSPKRPNYSVFYYWFFFISLKYHYLFIYLLPLLQDKKYAIWVGTWNSLQKSGQSKLLLSNPPSRGISVGSSHQPHQLIRRAPTYPNK